MEHADGKEGIKKAHIGGKTSRGEKGKRLSHLKKGNSSSSAVKAGSGHEEGKKCLNTRKGGRTLKNWVGEEDRSTSA